MEKTKRRNVTFSLPVDLIKAARLLAVERETSLSGLLREALESMVESNDRYRQAMQEEISLMEGGLPLGTEGRATWTRDELHER